MMDLLSLRWYLNYGRLNKEDSLKSNLKMISLDNGKMQKRNKQWAATSSSKECDYPKVTLDSRRHLSTDDSLSLKVEELVT